VFNRPASAKEIASAIAKAEIDAGLFLFSLRATVADAFAEAGSGMAGASSAEAAAVAKGTGARVETAVSDSKLGVVQKTAPGATTPLTQAESSALSKINNILTKNLKGGPKGDISGAVHDMVGNPIPKPGGGTWDHVQDLGNMLRGLRNNAAALSNATDPAAVAARQQALQAIQQIEEAIQGAGL